MIENKSETKKKQQNVRVNKKMKKIIVNYSSSLCFCRRCHSAAIHSRFFAEIEEKKKKDSRKRK